MPKSKDRGIELICDIIGLAGIIKCKVDEVEAISRQLDEKLAELRRELPARVKE